jgi:hypothetical protein
MEQLPQLSEEEAIIRNLKGMRMFLSDSDYNDLSPEKRNYYKSTPVTREVIPPEETQGDNDYRFHYPADDEKYQLKSEYYQLYSEANPRENPENVGGKRRKSQKSRKSKKSRKFKRKSIKKSKRRYRK